MKEFLLVSAGSFVGGGLRFLTAKMLGNVLASTFPWGTFAVNIAGCFLIGLFTSLSIDGHLSTNMKLLLATGFCGGFTTFSTFINENYILSRDRSITTAVLYTLASVALGMLALIAGYKSC